MATRTGTPRSRGSRGGTGAPSVEAGLERLIEPALCVVGAVLGMAFVLPLLLVAAPVWLALSALRTRSRRATGVALVACALPSLVALLWAYVVQGKTPPDVATGYADAQLGAGEAVLRAWPVADWTPLLVAYAGAVLPYAAAGGALAGATGFVSCGRWSSRGERPETPPESAIRDAGALAAGAERPVAWMAPRVVGHGVLSLLSAPPGLGKGWWTWGLLRAMQDGGTGGGATFFGLPVRRPRSSPGALARRLGARPRPRRVLWLTEEGESFARTARRFGIAPGLVDVLRRDQVPPVPWPELLRWVRRQARRRGCGLVIVDTVRAWCPQAERSPEEASAVMLAARKHLTGPGLGALFVHHDRKGGGEHGEGVSGTYGLVGAVDILIQLGRVRGRPDARRMVVSRRFGDLDATARLVGHRYVADGAEGLDAGPAAGASAERVEEGEQAPPSPPLGRPEYQAYLCSEAWAERRAAVLQRAGGTCERCAAAPPAEVHHLTYERLGAEREDDLVALCPACHRGRRGAHAPGQGALHPSARRTLARLQRLGRELGTDELLRLEQGSKKALLARLRALERAGLAAHLGRGVRGDPQRWRALPLAVPEPGAGPREGA